RSAGVGRRGAGARARDRLGEALPGAERVHLRPRASQSGAGARAEAAARARHRSAVADRRSGAGGGAGAGRAPLARIRDARSRLMPGSFAALQKSLARGAGNRLNRARSGTARPMAGDDSRTAVSATWRGNGAAGWPLGDHLAAFLRARSEGTRRVNAPTSFDKANPLSGTLREKLVVIGNGMAGCRAVEEILARDPGRYSVTIFGAEP